MDLFRKKEKQMSPAGLVVSCVSLWQPWASLIAEGVKDKETRSWAAPASIVGRRIGIHAAKTTQGLRDAARVPELWEECLEKLEWDAGGNLPLGAIVAFATVAASRPVESCEPDIYGNYSLGRWAWVLKDVRKLDEPIPARGAQGIFKAELPIEMEAAFRLTE